MRPLESRLLLRAELENPFGAITIAGTLKHDTGLPRFPLRVFGQYALVLLLEGEGRYVDALGSSLPVTAGDAIIVFPEVAHSYGPAPGGAWSELYVAFAGPCFDLLRESGGLDPSRPVVPARPLAEWQGRLEDVSLVAQDSQIDAACRLLAILSELMRTPRKPSSWLSMARSVLEEDLAGPFRRESVEARTGASYDAFRKRFRAATGMSPNHYRERKRIEAACSLLERTEMPNRVIAESLGYFDEFHFSKAFKRVLGVTPRAFRNRQLDS